MEILIIEDDPNLGNSLVKIFENEKYKTQWFKSIKDSEKHFYSLGDHAFFEKYALIILDWTLEDGHGIDFLKLIRSRNVKNPVIFLTARVDLIDKVVGLESGANDYMTKPFEGRELLARARVQLREHQSNLNQHFMQIEQNKIEQSKEEFKISKKIDNQLLTIDLLSRDVSINNGKIILTKMEFELLKILMQNPTVTFSREKLLDKVWGYEHYPTTRTVDTHVLQLRQKVHEKVIETIRGLGYRLGEFTEI